MEDFDYRSILFASGRIVHWCNSVRRTAAQLEFMPQSVTTSQRRGLLAWPNELEISNKIKSFPLFDVNYGVLRIQQVQ